ncbi:MAG: hypothetical protein LBU65_16105 [Planctomycetaceae bacterium]|jgi:hypothetical protein|nr:hypothetical protein [Planctomycetaceae bacterium]
MKTVHTFFCDGVEIEIHNDFVYGNYSTTVNNVVLKPEPKPKKKYKFWQLRREPDYDTYVGMFGDVHVVDNNSIPMRIMYFFEWCICATAVIGIGVPILLCILYIILIIVVGGTYRLLGF